MRERLPGDECSATEPGREQRNVRGLPAGEPDEIASDQRFARFRPALDAHLEIRIDAAER